MNLSLKWLSQLVDIQGLSEDDIIARMLSAGLEVESVSHLGEGTNLIVGEVIECYDHPDSDHLHITKVNIGKEVLDIVCGAPNCRKGLKVICAQVGAKLKDGEIKPGKIRGVESNGMLCSLLELGIEKEMLPEDSASHFGIEELGPEFEVGETDILNKLGYEDTILDVSIYANRPDCLGMFAMAKEMAAILDRKCTLPEFAGKSDCGQPTSFKVTSKTANCPHFLAKVINHVEIGPSPKWMQSYLLANGIKSINNLVDISNIVMLETGQPLHFYDLRSNPNREITVVDDYEGQYEALDGNQYAIEKGDIMITTGGKNAGIAGIMGGENTKILEDTTGLIIECALFDHAQIRRTANRIGLQTEAAGRFSKGLEPLAQNKAMDRAVDLLLQYANASELEATVECGKADYVPYEVVETVEHLNGVIGKTYTVEEVVEVLRRFDFNPRVEGDKIISTIPSYRSMDIHIPEDIDEEVVRISGFDDLEATLPKMPATIGRLTKRQQTRRYIRETLKNAGLNETVTYTLIGENYHNDEMLPIGENIELCSPLSDAHKYIRASLMNSMVEALQYNLKHNNVNINLFELSMLYAKNQEPQEHLGILLNGDLSESKVLHTCVKNNFYVIKGLTLEILSLLGFEIGRITVEENTLDTKHFHPYQSCVLKMNKEVIAILGKLHPAFSKANKLGDTYYCEMNLEPLIANNGAKIKTGVVNKYPSISRDISLVVKDEVKAADLLKLVKKAGGPLVKSVQVFDVYNGGNIEKGYKSISISIDYESKEKTLKVEDILPIHQKVLDTLNKEYNANLRA